MIRYFVIFGASGDLTSRYLLPTRSTPAGAVMGISGRLGHGVFSDLCSRRLNRLLLDVLKGDLTLSIRDDEAVPVLSGAASYFLCADAEDTLPRDARWYSAT